jgi:multidrug efflux pump subunit AcrB
VIYALLAVPLRSYGQPLIIMAVIPFGLVGAIGGHLLMRMDLSMMSVFGVVALSGVVVNSSLVLVHYVNQRYGTGDSLESAVREAGVARFRPIVLTSLTTFAGLTPLLMEGSVSAQFLIPMATSLGFGVVFASSISLFLVPSLYMILEDAMHLVRQRPSEKALDRVRVELATGGRPPV